MADLHDQVAKLQSDVTGTKQGSTVRTTTAVAPNPAVSDVPAAVSGANGGGSSAAVGSSTALGANVAVVSKAVGAGGGVADGPHNETELTDVDVPSQARAQLPADMVKAPWERLELPALASPELLVGPAPQVLPAPLDLPVRQVQPELQVSQV